MNQEQMTERMKSCRDQLKLALHHADAMVNGIVTPPSITSLWQISGKAHGAITALKSEVCGNEPPKIG
jgi:hypothetical protein